MLFEDLLYSQNDFEAKEGRKKKELLVKFVDTHLTEGWWPQKRWVTTEPIELCGAGILEQETWVSYRKWHLALTKERSELGNAHTHLLAPPGVGKSPTAGKGEENTEGQSLVENIHTNGLL